MADVTILVEPIESDVTVVVSEVTSDKLIPTGGTTNQVLTKASATDYDTSWQSIKTIGGESLLGSGDVAVTTVVENIPLAVANWTLVGDFYEYDYANVLIKSTSKIEVIPYNDSIELVKTAEIMPMVLVSAGTVKIYAKNLPTDIINVAILIQL